MASIQPTLAHSFNQPAHVSQDSCEEAIASMRGCLGALRCILEAQEVEDHDREGALDLVADQIDANLTMIRNFFYVSVKGTGIAA